jgi:phosphoribosyl 1,2-cyclic phosphate phosphodiesterase
VQTNPLPNAQRTLTFLGTGTSQGVPVIGCPCDVCSSSDDRDKRLRTAAMLTIEGKNYVIDTGPDFRQQMLRENVQSLEAVMFTHEHNDHIVGLDDVRPFNFKQNSDMPLYVTTQVKEALKQRFAYAFAPNPYPGSPRLALIDIDKNTIFQLDGMTVQPIEIMHGSLPILGFRFDTLTYITDCKKIEYKEWKKILGTRILVIDALHHKPHHSHLSLVETLEMIDQIQPEKAYLIHMSHRMGKHSEVQLTLPPNVFLAYDGLKINF